MTKRDAMPARSRERAFVFIYVLHETKEKRENESEIASESMNASPLCSGGVISSLYFPGFPILAFPGIPAFLHFPFPGIHGLESREIKFCSFYLVNTSNFAGFFSIMYVLNLVFHDDG
jgi:hypothetical protein